MDSSTPKHQNHQSLDFPKVNNTQASFWYFCFNREKVYHNVAMIALTYERQNCQTHRDRLIDLYWKSILHKKCFP